MDDRLLRNLVTQYGTPLYVFDGDGIANTCHTMTHLLPKGSEIFFSVKANPSLAICQLVKTLGSGIEVASSGELCLAMAAGCSPEKVIFSGPGKTVEELEYAIELGIAAIIAESLAELERIERLGAQRGIVVPIGIRLNPDYDLPNAKIKMAGSGKQFGIDADDLSEVMAMIQGANHLKLVCLHVYVGTQIFEYEMLAANVRNVLELARKIIVEYGEDLQMIDFGGGFGVPYFGESHPFDFYSFGREMEKIYCEYETICQGRRLVFESGRFLLAENGYYLTQVLYRKMSKGTIFLVTDGGMNQHVLSTFRGRQIRNNFPLHFLEKTGEKETVTIAGPLCTPDDILGRNVEMVKAEPGDVLCIPKSGAYGLTYSPVHFLGHPSPAEVLYYQGQDYLIRERGEKEDILTGQVKMTFGEA